MVQYLKITLLGLIGMAALLLVQANQEEAFGPGCDEEPSTGSQGMTLPGGPSTARRVRRAQPALEQLQNPLSAFLPAELGPQLENIQSSAKMIGSLFNTNPNQAAAASQLQQAFQPQPQQQQPSVANLMSQLTGMVRSVQDGSSKAVAASQQQAQQAVEASQQQAQQAAGGARSALTELGQGLQRIAMNNPSLLPDIKNLYSSVSSKLSSSSSSVSQPASFPSSGPIVPAKNGEQLIDNLAKVATGQTQ